MKTGVVANMSDWKIQVLNAVGNKNSIVYWTSGWLPKQIINRIEINNGDWFVLGGDIINQYSISIVDLYNNYNSQNQLNSIGLKSKGTLSEFLDLINTTFTSKVPETFHLGCIEININQVSKTIYNSNKNIKNLSYIKGISKQTCKTNSKIVYY